MELAPLLSATMSKMMQAGVQFLYFSTSKGSKMSTKVPIRKRTQAAPECADAGGMRITYMLTYADVCCLIQAAAESADAGGMRITSLDQLYAQARDLYTPVA